MISWPKSITPDKTPRRQFHHVNDIAPTIYDILGITPPKVVNGIAQDPIDGISMAYTFADAAAPGRKKLQYFENNGSRAIYSDGWMASAFGPLIPWQAGGSDLYEMGRADGPVGAVRPRHDDSRRRSISAPRSRRGWMH